MPLAPRGRAQIDHHQFNPQQTHQHFTEDFFVREWWLAAVPWSATSLGLLPPLLRSPGAWLSPRGCL